MVNKWIFSAATETGSREKNEDNFYVAINASNQLLIVVCDGIGGDINSEIASEITVNVFKMNFDKYNSINEWGGFKKFYNHCLQHASQEIDYASKIKLPKNGKMGTTVNAVFVDGNNVYCANIGDSHTYHYIAETNLLQLVSYDHNFLNYIKTTYNDKRQRHPTRVDDLDKEEAFVISQHRENLLALTNCLETGSKTKDDSSAYNTFTLEKGDQIIVCTDGVYNWIRAMDVINILKQDKYLDVAKNVIKVCIKNKSNDNLTFVSAKYE